MSPFQESDRDYFFGREKFVEQLVNAIQSQPLVAVIGVSGSGKSSVVRAGLFPQLLEQNNWLIVSFRPGSPNNNPFWNLASVLVPLLKTQMNQNERLEKIRQQSEQLSQGEIQLSDVIADISQKHSHKRLLLFVDQFEELYARCFRNTQEQGHLIQKQQSFTQEQHHFVDTLLTAVHSDSCPVTLVLTLRLDFYSYVLNYPRFAQALEPSHRPILDAMNQTEMLSCIERPAAKTGIKLEEGLTQRILDDVKREPGNLPLLEFALYQLWKKQSRGLLTHQAYTEIGGVAKALALHAEEVYTKLSEEEQKQAQRLFVQLVRPGEGTEDTRRLATSAEVGNWELVRRLADARLVVTGRDEQTQEQTVEIVHGALIREWGRLRGWMDSDRTFRTWQEGLRAAMHQWEESSGDLGALLRGKPLADAEDWLHKRKADLEAEQNYIEKSLALRKREKEERDRRRWLTILGLMVFSFFAGVGVAWWKQEIADAESLGTTALKNFESGAGEIEALVSAMQAGHKLKKLKKLALWHGQCLQDCPATTPLLALQTIVDNIHQKNQINTYQKGINSLRFIQNDQQIATAGDDGSVRWYQKGTQVKSFKLQNQSIISIDFIPKENILITGASNGWVQLWDISQIWNISGKKVKRLPRLPTKPMYHSCANGDKLTEYQLPESKDAKCRVNNVRFLPKSNLIATTGDDGKLRLWKLNGESVLTVDAHEGSIKSLNPSPDGEQLATAGEDGVAKLWDLNGKPLQSFEGHNKLSVNSIWYKPDGTQVATASDDGTVKLWDVNNGKLLKEFPAHFEGVESVRISPDGKQIATAGKYGTVRLWDLNGKRLAELKGHQGSVVSIRFNKDGKTLATSGKDDGTVRLWDVSKQKKHLTLKEHSKSVSKSVNSVRFNPQNSQQIATASDDGTVKLWNFKDNEWVDQTYQTFHGNVKSVRFNPQNPQQIATAGSDGTVRLLDLTGKKKIEPIETGQGNVESIDFSPDGNQIATAGFDGTNGTVKLWNLTDKPKLLKEFPSPFRDKLVGMVESVRFSPDDELLAIVGSDGKATLWDIIKDKPIELEGHRGSVYSASFRKDSPRLATAGDDGTVRLWNLERLATAGNDGIVRLWNLKGKELPEIKTFQGRVRNISFSCDGKLLATVAANHTVRLWNVLKRKQVAEYKGHQGSVRSVDFSPNGKQLVTASTDGTAIVWSITGLDDLLNEGCAWLKDYLTTNKEVQLEMCPQIERSELD